MFTELVQGIGWMYGMFVITGGVIGYLQAGSTTSLYTGIVAGSLAVCGGILVKKSEKFVDIGLKLLSAVSIGLLFIFQRRLQETGFFKFMPSGFMMINSLGILVLSVLSLKERSVVSDQKNK